MAELETLVALFRGSLDELGDWEVAPCYSSTLAETICRQLQPTGDQALIRFVLYDGTDLPLSREEVGEQAWDALVCGYSNWRMAQGVGW